MGTTRKETGGHFQTADPKTEEAAGGSGRERLGWGSGLGKGQTWGSGMGLGGCGLGFGEEWPVSQGWKRGWAGVMGRGMALSPPFCGFRSLD